MDSKQFEVSFDFLKEQIAQVNKSVEKLADSQVTMNNVLIENTIIVKEHERRSTAFEGWAGKFEDRMGTMFTHISKINNEVSAIEKDLTPIRNHVAKVTKIISFLSGIPVVMKVTMLTITVLSAAYGAFTVLHAILPRN